MAIQTLSSIPFSVTGGLTAWDTDNIEYSPQDVNNTLSGYTNKLTTFIFAVSSYGGDIIQHNTERIGLSKIVWDFGDGTITKGFSASHVYTIPGVYNVQLVAYNNNGEETYSTHTRQLSVSDFIEDRLYRPYDDIINLLNIPAGTGGSLQMPITVERYNSWQSYPALSAAGYTLNLYASGSRARRLDIDRFSDYKWSHLDKTWSFYEKLTADDGTIDYGPIGKIKTVDEEIYITKGINSFNRATSSAPDAIFVGTSGTSEFFYGDDVAKNYSTGTDDSPVFLFASLDTTQFPYLTESRRKVTYDIPSLKHQETYTIVIPVKTRFSRATELSFTSNGLLEMPISNIKWQSVEVPFVINLINRYNSRAEDYPVLTINSTTTPDSGTWVVNVSVVSGQDTNFRLLSADFFKTKDNQLPNVVDSIYRGYFIPRETGDNVQLKGEVVINDPPHSDRDILFGFLTNPQYDKVYRVAPGQKYAFDGDTGKLNVTLPGNRTAHALSAGGFYPISVVPVTASYINNDIYAYFADTHNDKVYKYDNNMTLLSTYDFNQKIDIATTGSTTSATLISINDKDNPDRLTPSDIAIDGNKQLWITMHDGNLVVRLDPERSTEAATGTGWVDRVIRDDTNITYNDVLDNWSGTAGVSYLTLVSATSGLAGMNLTEPTSVDCDIDNNIWISYSNPLNGFVIKYDTSVDPCSAMFKYNFPDYEAPTDIVIDNDSNLWVCTQKHFIRGTVSEWTGDVTASKQGHTFNFQFGSDHPFQAGQLIRFEPGTFTNPAGFVGQQNYDGTHIIEAVSARYVEVHPYAGLVHSTQTNNTQTLTVATTVKSYKSDNLYKFSPDGTMLFSVSGLHMPSYVIVDNYQNAWVTHDTNTISRITSGGDLDIHIPVLHTDFVELSGGKSANPTLYGIKQHLGGIACDFYNQLWVINSYENRVYYLPLYNMSLSGTQYIDQDVSVGGTGSNLFQAIGDWTSYEWFNKYAQLQGIRTITGSTTFTIYPSTGQYHITKFGEDFDPAETIKSYRQQPFLKEYNKLFDDIIGQSVGTLSSDPTTLGKLTYEKISNFLDNHSDVDTCTINALYSLCEQHGVSIDNYNFQFPSGVKRILDLTSIHRNKLWGERSKYARDFDGLSEFAGYNADQPAPATRPVNIGLKTVTTDSGATAYHVDELDTGTYMVTAGTKIVAKQLYDNQFKIINPMYLSGTGSEPFSASVGSSSLVWSYPLSAYHVNWGWGLYNDINGIDIKEYYKFYSYNQEYNNTQQEGIIDWDNPLTTLVDNLCTINTWTEDDGIIDIMLDYELRKGLNMFTDTISAGTPTYQ